MLLALLSVASWEEGGVTMLVHVVLHLLVMSLSFLDQPGHVGAIHGCLVIILFNQQLG